MGVTERRVGRFALLLAAGIALGAGARVLPEDRSDVLWHLYDGGGVTIQGPSVLVRKAYKDKLSVWGNYYVDMISGASIDVETTASPYTEERREASAGVDFLYDKATLSASMTRSNESDYEAETWRVNVSQDFFGDLTTVSLGYARGADTVRRNGDAEFVDNALHQSFRLDVAQILTRRLIVGLGVEAVVDDGYLNNPYRSVVYADPDLPRGYAYQREQYPRSRASDAAAVHATLYLGWRAAIKGQYRYYTDSWGIVAHTGEVGYVHPLNERWEFDVSLRHYTQGQATFYRDQYAHRDAMNFLARDKELSAFTTNSIGGGLSISSGNLPWFSRGSLNLRSDFVRFDYDNFSDLRDGTPTPYAFDAWVVRAFISVWY